MILWFLCSSIRGLFESFRIPRFAIIIKPSFLTIKFSDSILLETSRHMKISLLHYDWLYYDLQPALYDLYMYTILLAYIFSILSIKSMYLVTSSLGPMYSIASPTEPTFPISSLLSPARSILSLSCHICVRSLQGNHICVLLWVDLDLPRVRRMTMCTLTKNLLCITHTSWKLDHICML